LNFFLKFTDPDPDSEFTGPDPEGQLITDPPDQDPQHWGDV